MATISRVPVSWTGAAVVGGGFTVLHCDAGDEHALMDAFRSMLNSVSTAFPSNLQWTFPTSGITIDEATGHPNGTWTDGTPVAPLTATGANTWANGVGLRIKWTTAFVNNGTLVVGSTFMVPLTIAAYEGAGNILDSMITNFATAANTFAATALLRIYSRPRSGLNGVSFPISGFSIPDRVSWLRGRRT